MAVLDELPTRVLCVDLGAQDAASQHGAMLAWHASRGHGVRCVYPGRRPDSGASCDPGLAQLCPDLLDPIEWSPATSTGFEIDGLALDAHPLLVERLRETVQASGAELVYGPGLDGEDGASGLERRALGRAIRAAIAGLDGVRLLEASSTGELNFELPADLASHGSSSFSEYLAPATGFFSGASEGPQATAVICTWNKCADVRANLEALRAQTRPFADVIVVDNASNDETTAMIAREFPEVRLIVMPHSQYGACETFNIGFASVTTLWTVILDDDVVLPAGWLERAASRFLDEPDATAVLSSKIVEPGMPESYRNSPAVNRERYMSTFRGCASLARSSALAEAGGYDERLYIYGNERDLTCRLLNLGYRVLQYPGVAAYHKTPFGVQMGKRSLYYHARNAWLGMLKYAPLADLLRMPYLVLTKVLLRSRSAEVQGEVSDATGTIGLGHSIRQTPGAWWVLVRAALSVLVNLPYCMRHRAPVRSADFELPIK